MIYTGYFQNRVGNLIEVYFDTQEDEQIIVNTDLKLSSGDFNNVTTANRQFQYNVGTKKVLIEQTDLNVRLCEIRLFEGKPIKITKRVGNQCRYAITNLEKNYSEEVAFLTNNVPLEFTPSKDGYLLINISMSGTPPQIMGETTRQKVDDSLIFSSDPVTISNKSDGIFSPLKLSSATVRLMTEKVLYDLYTTKPQGVKCVIKNYNTDTTLFFGYVTPNIYSQNYIAPYDELEVECVSPFSTLDSIKWRGEQDNILTWYDILYEIFNTLGYSELINHFYVHKCLEIDQDEVWLKNTLIDQAAFEDKDGYITCKKILENFCATFGLSLCEINGEVFFLDYNRIVDDLPFINYVFDGTTELFTYTAPTGVIPTMNGGNNNISFDDCYEKVVATANVDAANKDYFKSIYNEDDLICLHPNIPYITFESNDSSLYIDTNIKHVDIYRIYINRNFKHYSYNSKFNGSTAYGFDTTVEEISTATFGSWMPTDNRQLWSANFMTYLRNHLCAFVVKRFSYEYGTDADNKQHTIPSSYKWENNLLISYGLKGMLQGDYTTKYQQTYSECLRNHYGQVWSRPILENTDTFNPIEYATMKRYLQTNGSVYFMRGQYLNTGGDLQNEKLVKEDADTYNTIKTNYFMSNPKIFELYIGSTDYSSTDYVFEVDLRKYGSSREVDRDKVCSQMKKLLYNWLELDPLGYAFGGSNIPFTDGIPEAEGHLVPITSNYKGNFKFTAPWPYAAANSVQCTFALVKDNSLEVVKQYPMKEAIEGKKITDDYDYEMGTSNAKPLEIDVPYVTQRDDIEFCKNALIFNNAGVYEYLKDHIHYKVNEDGTVEDMLLYKNFNHYKDAKFILNAKLGVSKYHTKEGSISTLNDDGVEPDLLIPLNTLQSSKDLLFDVTQPVERTFIIDQTEYDVLDATKQLKLIEI